MCIRDSSNDYVVTVKSYDGNATEVTLPTKATIDEVEYTITCIGDGVFQDNHRITSVRCV